MAALQALRGLASLAGCALKPCPYSEDTFLGATEPRAARLRVIPDRGRNQIVADRGPMAQAAPEFRDDPHAPAARDLGPRASRLGIV
jgi:hypothetical protein